MTTETYPYIGPDMTYEHQRKCRMQDAIHDYLEDDTIDSQQICNEMLDCVQDVIDYHQKSLDRAVALKSLMQGEMK